MALRKFAVGMAGALVFVAVASAVIPWRTPLRQPQTPGSAQLKVFGGRSTQQVASVSGQKFDAALAQIASHSKNIRPDHALEDLRNLNPAAHFTKSPDGTPLVLVDAITKGDPLQLKSKLIGMGLKRPAQYLNDVSGWLPVAQLDAVTDQTEVHSIQAAMPYTRSGATTTQGDFVMNAPAVRANNSLSGNGVKVGILSDSYDCYAAYAANGIPANGHNGYANENGITTTAAQDVASGDLPSGVVVNEESSTTTPESGNSCFAYDATDQLPFGDEGRAMMQIVHDVAPGASLNFYPAIFGQADFASGIETLASQGATVIADDVGYFEEPFFQDGIVSQAITTVRAEGVAYFTAAGNNANYAFDIPTDPKAAATTPILFPTAGTGANGAAEKLMNFDATAQSTVSLLHVTVPAMRPGDFLAVVVQWDQPFTEGAAMNSTGATSQIDVCLKNVSSGYTTGNDNLSALTNNCSGVNAIGKDPYQVLILGNPASNTSNTAPGSFDIQVGLANNTPAPNRIKVAVEADGLDLTMSPFFTGTSPTIQGHSMSADAITVGAALYSNTPACGAALPVIEDYSSYGGGPILFDATGARLAAPQVRAKPDVVGPDGGSDTFLGHNIGAVSSSISACVNGTQFPNFQGTSAATPHVASVAALLLEADPALRPTDMYMIIQQSTLSMAPASASIVGSGFIQADIAATKTPAVVPPAPVLTLASTTTAVGGTNTLTWTSSNNQGCTASGAWTGAQPSNGQLTITPTTAGSLVYTLTCTNVAGTSAATSVTLTVTAAASGGGGHGGGSFDLGVLLVLSGLITHRAARARRASLN